MVSRSSLLSSLATASRICWRKEIRSVMATAREKIVSLVNHVEGEGDVKRQELVM